MVKNIIENNLAEMEFFKKEINKDSHDFFKRI